MLFAIDVIATLRIPIHITISVISMSQLQISPLLQFSILRVELCVDGGCSVVLGPIVGLPTSVARGSVNVVVRSTSGQSPDGILPLSISVLFARRLDGVFGVATFLPAVSFVPSRNESASRH